MATKFNNLYKTHWQIIDEISAGHKEDVREYMRFLHDEYHDLWRTVRHESKEVHLWLMLKDISKGVFGDVSPNWNKEQLHSTMTVALPDAHWRKLGRPYYNVWPKILKSFLRLDFSVLKGEHVRLPKNPVALRIPIGMEFNLPVGSITGILMCPLTMKDAKKTESIGCVHLNMFIPQPFGHNVEGHSSINIELCKGETLAESMEQITSHVQTAADNPVSTSHFIDPLKLGVAICMLSETSEFLIPSFENVTDAQRKALTGKELEQYYKKQGRGYDLGKEGAEVEPHLRRPHPVWQAYGTKREKRKLIIRSGSIVHRSKIDNIPSGWEEDIKTDNFRSQENDDK